jgi:hypothetical protein
MSLVLLLQTCLHHIVCTVSSLSVTQIIRWTKGGFGMAAHNYDGDMLTDEVAQVHRSPGFITSNLIGKNDDGSLIKGELWKQRRGRFRCLFCRWKLLCGVSLLMMVLARVELLPL